LQPLLFKAIKVRTTDHQFKLKMVKTNKDGAKETQSQLSTSFTTSKTSRTNAFTFSSLLPKLTVTTARSSKWTE
jgi:hypothetical protein